MVSLAKCLRIYDLTTATHKAIQVNYRHIYAYWTLKIGSELDSFMVTEYHIGRFVQSSIGLWLEEVCLVSHNRTWRIQFMRITESGNGSQLKSILDGLIKRSGSLTSLVVTKEGIAVAVAGDTSYLNTTAMAALIAGMFSATREVARMVGEEQFSILLQQGENRHIHISLIRDSRMMVIVFEDYQRIGMVRHEARRAAEEINKSLEDKIDRSEHAAEVADPQFREYALNLIDSIFQTK